MSNINNIYKEEIEGRTSPTEPETKSNKNAEKYVERFEIWCNDPTSQIILKEIITQRERYLTLAMQHAGDETIHLSRLYTMESKTLTMVLNLMTKGEYKL